MILLIKLFLTSTLMTITSSELLQPEKSFDDSMLKPSPITVSENFSDISPIYYTMDGQPVPRISTQDEVLPISKKDSIRYGWLPCSCQNYVCGCCSNININTFNFKRKGCMNFTYDPNEFALNMDMLMNEESIYHNSISGKNPPPACFPISPVPFIPGLEFCIHLYNIYTPGNNINVCVNFETQIVRVPLLVLQFDCFRMGQDGFAIVKPNAENAGLPTTSTSIPVEDADPLTPSSTEFYDEVIEEKNTNNVQ